MSYKLRIRERNARPRNKCLYPPCQHKEYARGLCLSCLKHVVKQVDVYHRLTWEQLEKAGKCKPLDFLGQQMPDPGLVYTGHDLLLLWLEGLKQFKSL